jgi:hypothetical protein
MSAGADMYLGAALPPNFPSNLKLYGVSYTAAIQTDAEMQHWIDMSQIAWGAHA